MTVDLPSEVPCRGVSINEVIAELADTVPDELVPLRRWRRQRGMVGDLLSDR